jgi:hypothetical protein
MREGGFASLSESEKKPKESPWAFVAHATKLGNVFPEKKGVSEGNIWPCKPQRYFAIMGSLIRDITAHGCRPIFSRCFSPEPVSQPDFFSGEKGMDG